MKSVLQQASADAASLANTTQSVTADNMDFTHYCGGLLPNKQLTNFQNIMKNTASSANNYAIQLECENVPGSDDESAMATDASSGSPTDVEIIQVHPQPPQQRGGQVTYADSCNVALNAPGSLAVYCGSRLKSRTAWMFVALIVQWESRLEACSSQMTVWLTVPLQSSLCW
jgi:hypothetical protein